MATPQMGVFSLGTSVHGYLELDRLAGASAQDLVAAVATLEEPHSTIGGVNLVVGLRPEIWAEVAPDQSPTGATSFAVPIEGIEGFTMPATQHDAWLWVAGAAHDVVFDAAASAVHQLAGVASVATEITGWSYRSNRDLTGFEDGTENPSLTEAAGVVAVSDGLPGAGSTIVLVQQWAHDTAAWEALDTTTQERVMGRTKADSIEFDDDVKPADSHVARTVVEVDGEELSIFRRNTPYGSASAHGTMFVGFSHDQGLLHRMLLRMAGAEDGIRDALTRYTTPLTGAYYVCPSIEALAAFAPPEPD
jgi:putative iron-dependent peroxidase